MAGLLLGAIAWALYRCRTRLAVLGENGLVPWRPDFPSVEFPPQDDIIVINRPWPGWMASSLVLAGILSFAGSIYLAHLQSTSPSEESAAGEKVKVIYSTADDS